MPAHFDAVALSAFILGQTERVRLFQDVANLPMRHPVVLAKTAATLDRLSGGRVELGLGAGAFWDAIRGLGGPLRKPKAALDALEEVVIVIRGMWSGQRGMRFGGEHYPLHGAHGGPVPAHEIGIWLGVVGPKALALAGRIGDGWIPSMSYVPPIKAIESNAIIDRAAVAAGREPPAIRRIYVRSRRPTRRPTTSTGRSLALPSTGSRCSLTSRSTSASPLSCWGRSRTGKRSAPSSRRWRRPSANASPRGGGNRVIMPLNNDSTVG